MGPIPDDAQIARELAMRELRQARFGGGGAGGGGANGMDDADFFPNIALLETSRRVKLWSSMLLVWSTLQLFAALVDLADPSRRNAAEPASGAGGSGGDDGSSGGSGDGDGSAELRAYLDKSTFARALELTMHSVGVYSGVWGFRASTLLGAAATRKYVKSIMWYSALWMANSIEMLVRLYRLGVMKDATGVVSRAVFLLLLPLFMCIFCIVQALRFRRAVHNREAREAREAGARGGAAGAQGAGGQGGGDGPAGGAQPAGPGPNQGQHQAPAEDVPSFRVARGVAQAVPHAQLAPAGAVGSSVQIVVAQPAPPQRQAQPNTNAVANAVDRHTMTSAV